MTEKRSKYDTDPLDPDFVRRTEEVRGGETAREQEAEPQPPPRPFADDPTRRFDEQMSASYPSVFVPPAYQPPPQQAQPFTSFSAGPHDAAPPSETGGPPPPGPSSPYNAAAPSSRPVAKLGIGENIATVLPYAPFYIGLVASIIELFVVPRHETRTRFHAAQGLALQLVILAGTMVFGIIRAITDSGLGGTLFWLASFAFLIVSMVRVWQGKPHHIAPLDEGTRQLNERLNPMQ
ncbi:MAG TPA: hypothetical protein VFS10_15935 [Pyrinomonadaceae bacterium]|nr:hypothetical protein [Pyrinomonadaceae bacterium]